MAKQPEKNPYTFNGKTYRPVRIDIERSNNKRYLLSVRFNKKNGNTDWLVVLKNPSKAGLSDNMESDLTIITVCNFFERSNIKIRQLTIVNLFPLYLTNSAKLREQKKELLDKKNIKTLKEQIGKHQNIVLAWGASPTGCQEQFNSMRNQVYDLLGEKSWYQMKNKKGNLNKQRPLHGQVWRKECMLTQIK